MPSIDRLVSRISPFVMVAAVLTALAAGVGVAAASERFTPHAVLAADEHVLCLVANVTETTRTVVIEIRDGGGSPVLGCSPFDDNPVSLPVSAGDVVFNSCPGPGARYCHFTVSGGKSAIRGLLEVRKSDLTKVLLLPAE